MTGSVPCVPRDVSSSKGRWLASNPAGPCVTRAPSGCSRIKACKTSGRVSSKAEGRYMVADSLAPGGQLHNQGGGHHELVTGAGRSEERRVGKECRARWV